MKPRTLAITALAILIFVSAASAQLWRDEIEFALEKKASYNYE